MPTCCWSQRMPDGAAPPRYGYPPRRMRAEEAARYVGLSETAFLALGLSKHRIGGTVGWLIETLDAYLDGQPRGTVGSAPANEWDAAV